jgi:hypothetical protein
MLTSLQSAKIQQINTITAYLWDLTAGCRYANFYILEKLAYNVFSVFTVLTKYILIVNLHMFVHYRQMSSTYVIMI